MPNDLNSISPDIRDFLLNRNLILSDTVTDNGLSGLAVGLGQQSPIQTFPVAVQASENIETTSETQRESLISKNPYSSTEDLTLTNITFEPGTGNIEPGTPSVEYGKYVGSQTEGSKFNDTNNDIRRKVSLKNQYISEEQMVNATIVNNSFAYTQIDGGYLIDGQLNLGGASTEPHDTVGALLSGKGYGLDAKGLVSQFNIRSSLAGRVLGAVGAINDTPLGIIGGEQLLLALGQKDIFNAQNIIKQNINTNVIGLIKGEALFKADFSVTTKPTLGGKILNAALDLSGFELPKSQLGPGASIFQDSKIPFYNFNHVVDSSSTSRNIEMLKYTGKGQYLRLFDLLNENKYKPDYNLNDNSKDGITDPVIYQGETIDGINPSAPNNDSDGSFMWGQTEPHNVHFASSDTILGKTKQLFDSNRELEMVNFTNNMNFRTHGELSTPVNHNGSMVLSKGSGVLGSQALTGTENIFGEDADGNQIDTDNVFCRTWTSTRRYDNISALQKNSGLTKYSDRIRNNVENSVLGENGFVKISPYRNNAGTNLDTGDVKRYMFSIENLAWNDSLSNLPKIETGPGDLTTGTKGRIMWFPPYGMKFSDTTSVNWDTTKFIGRGEPIYTYNNTERSGNLEFQIIIDYPDYLNGNSSLLDSDEILASIAAGCTDYESLFSTKEQDAINNEIKSNIKPIKKSKVGDKGNFPELNIYFDNDIDEVDNEYERYGNSKEKSLDGFYGLNRPWTDKDKIKDLADDLNGDYSAYKMTIIGYASKDGIPAIEGQTKKTYNQLLSERRANNVKEWILINLNDKSDPNFSNRIFTPKGEGEELADADPGNYDSLKTKKDRRVTIKFEYDVDLDKQVTDSSNAKTEATKTSKELVNRIKSRFHNEGKYFKELAKSEENSDKIIYKTIKEKVGFFQPAFHSITPEGFNSRLTFLQQCTRQGPTSQKTGSQNLAFGMPPVCILRIGDFYHTKIIIESVGLTFEPLVWDLNPEGVGVQPMIANVSMSFKFIGGSSLTGPINKLQNAVSFNYFANTEVYDPRADTIIAKVTDNGDKEYKVMSGVTNMSLSDADELNTNNEIENLDTTRPEVKQIFVAKAELEKLDADKPIATPKIISYDTIDGTSTFVETISIIKPEDSIIIPNPDGSSFDVGIPTYIDTFNSTFTFICKTENIIGNEDDEFYEPLLGKGFKVILSKINNSASSERVFSHVFLSVAEIKLPLLGGYGFNVRNIEEGDYELRIDNNGRRLDIYQFKINKDNTTLSYLK